MPQTGPASVIEAIKYSVEAGGKRLRPILTIAVAETLGAEEDSVIELACAMEYLHTYSLIHDDLPAMDNSDLRRGKPTCHRVYGEAIAVLAGDALLTLSFETIAKYGLRKGRESMATEIVLELATASGTAGMIGGQVLDLEGEGSALTLSEIEDIAAKKTGALLKAAIITGAIAAGGTAAQKSALTTFAENIGPAFQIVDDLLDRESTTEDLGKPAGADQARYKATFPAVLGVTEARKLADCLYSKAVAALADLDRPTDLLEALARRMIYRKM